MKRIIRGAALLTIAAGVSWQAVRATAPSATAAVRSAARVERGQYLVDTIGCHDCHTPKKPGSNGPELDLNRMLSGHPEGLELPPPPVLEESWPVVASWDFTAWSGPWGISYPMNLTPDENTGIGIWTEDMFITAIRQGRHMGVSRPILPPMPWEVYRNLTDEDLRSIFAFLRSVPPIHNRVPDPVFADGEVR